MTPLTRAVATVAMIGLGIGCAQLRHSINGVGPGICVASMLVGGARCHGMEMPR